MRVTRRNFTTVAASLLVLSPLGCATLPSETSDQEKSFFDRMPWASKAADEAPEPYPNPVKLAATWTPDTLVQTGRTPTRGFGGRVFFYDEKSRPVPVEGTLVVHGFDEKAPDPTDTVKRFEFTPEQFTRHFSRSDLGASYSIWIPWDAVGGDERRISLVASFKNSEGKLVQGIPATIMLPGKSAKPDESGELAEFSPQYQKYRAATESASPRTSGLTTTTIRRRTPVEGSRSGRPGIKIPNFQDPAAMVASDRRTPSLDLDMLRKPRRPSAVIPASAQLPADR